MKTKTITPEITLKNVKTFTGREGYGLNADLYVDGTKTAFCYDDASGGPLDFEVINQELFNVLKDYAKTTGTNVEMLVNVAFDLREAERAERAIIRKTKTSLVYNVEGTGYSFVNFKRPLENVPVTKLQEWVDKLKGRGDKIYNTNLSKLGVK